MKEQLDLLHQLQKLDTTIDACRDTLSSLDDGTQLRTELEAAREKQQEIEQELHDLRSTLRDKELELEGTENEREEKWNLAYGGTVSDSKELENLEKKLDELQRRTDTLENELLMGYEEADDLQQELQQQQEKVQELSEQLEETVDTFETTSTNLKQRIEESMEAKEQITGEIEDRLMKEYNRLREKMGGVAVAEIQGNVCSGCNVAVSDYILRKLKSGDELVKCENCLRILCYPG